MICALVSVYPFQFIFLELAAGLTAAFSINILSQRSQLLRTALFTFLAYCTAYTAIRLLSDGNLAHFEWRTIGAFAINAVVLSFAYILVLVVEKICSFTSTVTLVELSDINNPLLRRLATGSPRHIPAFHAGVHPRRRSGARHRRQHPAGADRSPSTMMSESSRVLIFFYREPTRRQSPPGPRSGNKRP